ncbi:MAG: hypothetical protein HPY81_08405 [Firmicutes bacterium]|nr:hypothetical protein [Bacillota bacterium]
MDFSDCDDRVILVFIIIQIVFTLVFFLLICLPRKDDPPEQVTTVDFTGTANLVRERHKRGCKKGKQSKELKEVLQALKDGGRLSLIINPADD